MNRVTTSPNLGRLGTLASLGAAMALATLPLPAFAVSWDGEATLSREDTYQQQIVRTGASSAVSAWFQFPKYIVMRRTTDGGVTWSAPVTLAQGNGFSLAGAGRRLDLTFPTQYSVPCDDGWEKNRLMYRRSFDGGRAWTTPRPLTSPCSRVTDTAVAHGPGGQVTVVWTDSDTGRVWSRTSMDHGGSFGPPRLVTQTTNVWSDDGIGGIYHADPQMAIGTGVTYLVFSPRGGSVSVTRSTDNGMTWSRPRVLSDNQRREEYSIVASGSRAVVGYATYWKASDRNNGVYRRTVDSGASWSSARVLISGPEGTFSAEPIFGFHGGTLGALMKYGVAGDSPIWHRQSTDFGATWSGRTLVSRVHFDDEFDPGAKGIAILDDRQLALYSENRGTGKEGLWVRRTEP
jgi:hypothetical protein